MYGFMYYFAKPPDIDLLAENTKNKRDFDAEACIIHTETPEINENLVKLRIIRKNNIQRKHYWLVRDI